MLTTGALAIASLLTLQADTTVLLGRVEKDLTGDGRPEILRVVGVGASIDSLAVTFTIESAGRTIYQRHLAPLTRTVGFDAGRYVVSTEQHRENVGNFGRWFLADSRFQSPSTFVAGLRLNAREHVAWIPDVIARDRSQSDSTSGRVIWEAMQSTPITIFTFSPGGDAVESIGWSISSQRFYRLVDCC